MLYLIRKRQKVIEKEEIETFNKNYGTFFEEFKDDDLSKWLFYILFIFRRIAMIISIYFLNDAILQLSIYLCFSLSVKLIQVSIYVIIVKPFKDSSQNYYQFLNEMIISAVAVSMIAQLIPNTNISLESTSDLCINLVISTWVLNIAFTCGGVVYQIFKKIKAFIKKTRLRSKGRQYRVTNITPTDGIHDPDENFKTSLEKG